ncbi:MAG: mismatch repair protein [Planctomycetaceae bacterium]|nr:mismatch repair protein [Planctomycetaceae bacterium]
MTDILRLDVQQDHVETLAKLRKPILGIEELIWNSLDADANEIRVSVTFDALGHPQKILISDNGSGISRTTCDEKFGSLGGSSKRQDRLTPSGRVVHGKYGKGRLKAFGLGNVVTWLSRFKSEKGIHEFKIQGRRSLLKEFEISEVRASRSKRTGVEVTISEIEQKLPSLAESSIVAEGLAGTLALYLQMYPGIAINYDGHLVDPAAQESFKATYELSLIDNSGALVPAELTVIEWKSSCTRALYFCDKDGFALHDALPGLRAPGFNFTAYLKSELVADLYDQNAFGAEHLHPIITELKIQVKNALRDHFRTREVKRSADLIDQWKQERVYPYDTHENDPVTQIEREVFEVCAVKVFEYLPSFEKADAKSKRLTFRLIREALESNPRSLQTILHQVLDLPKDQQDDLATILSRTHLGGIINASKTVINRLDFLSSLDAMLFGDLKATLLERKQLHRILAEELWIFGEQYTLAVDDQGLTEVLKKHLALLKNREFDLDEDLSVQDLQGHNRIVDLMVSRTIPQMQDGHFEHLIIELKRPKRVLGIDEITQIKNYAFTVAKDERFKDPKTRWTFLLLGNDLSEYADQECRVQGRDYGHIYVSDDGRINVHVKLWATVLAEARWRYKFFREQLNLQISTNDGVRYLREKYPQHIPDGAGSDGDGTEH